MKLSIEINEQAKKLLLELLQDEEIQNKILEIAVDSIESVEDAVDSRCQDFTTVEDVDNQIRDFLTSATFSANYEG